MAKGFWILLLTAIWSHARYLPSGEYTGNVSAPLFFRDMLTGLELPSVGTIYMSRLVFQAALCFGTRELNAISLPFGENRLSSFIQERSERRTDFTVR